MNLKEALTFSEDGRILLKCNENYEGKVIIPASASELQSSGLSRFFSSFTSSKVTTIGKEAFLNCQRVTSIVLPGSIELIGSNAFMNCRSLSSINIPDSVVRIEGLAFMNCSNLTSLHIPAGVRVIGMFAFSGCDGISRFDVARDNVNYCSEDGVLYSKDRSVLYQVPSSFDRYTIPRTVRGLENSAFSGCTRLAWIEIPENVISIPSGIIFRGCSGIRSIEVAVNNPVYRSINGALCSKDGTELIRVAGGSVSFNMPDSIVTIKENAMTDCEFIAEVGISRNVKNIEYDTFTGMRSLKRFIVAYDNPYFCGLNGAICSKDGRNLLHVPVGLDSFVIPDGIVYVNVYVGDEESTAFEGCERLASLTIPSSVREIGAYSFLDCENLREIHMKNLYPSVSFHQDSEIDPSRITLFVPYGSENAYRADPFFRQFAMIMGE